MKIRSLRVRPVLVPFRRPPLSASGAIEKAALVLFDLTTDDGVTGRSYVFGFTPWALGPIAASAQGRPVAGVHRASRVRPRRRP